MMKFHSAKLWVFLVYLTTWRRTAGVEEIKRTIQSDRRCHEGDAGKHGSVIERAKPMKSDGKPTTHDKRRKAKLPLTSYTKLETKQLQRVVGDEGVSFVLKEKMTIYHLNEYGVVIREHVPLLLEMDACHGVVITFMKYYKDKNSMYMSMWIGHNGMTKVFDCVNGPAENCNSKPVKVMKRKVWNCKGSTKIWLKWTNMGFVSVGMGSVPGQDTLVEYQGSKKPTLVNYIGVVLLEDTNVQVTAKTGGIPCLSAVSQEMTKGDEGVSFVLKEKMTIYHLNEYGVVIREHVPLLLEMDACHGVVITFMKYYKDKNSMYMSMWIGHNGMTKVFDCVNGPAGNCNSKPVKAMKRKVWNCKGSTKIWLKWTNMGFVSVGMGSVPGQDTLVEYQGSKKPTLVNYIGVVLLEDTNVRVTAKTVCLK